MTVTSHDVAREAGVSQPTVSRALRNDPRISEETKRRVMEAAQRLAYSPDEIARSLITGRTRTVGVVVADIRNPFYPELLDVVHSEFMLVGYRMVLLEGRVQAHTRDQVVPLLTGNAFDGVIFTTATLDSSVVVDLVRRELPVVLMHRYVEGVNVDRVTADNVGGGRIAAQFLTGLGHQRIGMVAGPANTSTSRDRELGFRSGLKAFGLSLAKELHRAGPYSHQTGYQGCMELMKQRRPPTAIFCGNDVIALGALDAALRLRIKIPQQLSILGFDDIEMASWESFNLSTIRQPMSRMAEVAVRFLMERIGQAHEAPARNQLFPTNLIKRNTTAPPGDSI
jgi:LacI family transcriptional regulator